MSNDASPDSDRNKAGSFPDTLWSVVAVAGRAGSGQSDAALNRLCEQYWYPLYCYIRRRGYSPDDAQDLVQGFFERLLRKEFFAEADRTKGKLRGFMLSSLQYFMLDERKKMSAAKRGGGVTFVQIDAEEADSRYLAEPENADSPDVVFERQWANTVMQRATDTLADAWRKEGKIDVFEALSPFLLSTMEGAAARQIASRFQMTEGHVKVSLHRLRERYSSVLRKEIAETVNSEAEIDSELAALRAAIQ